MLRKMLHILSIAFALVILIFAVGNDNRKKEEFPLLSDEAKEIKKENKRYKKNQKKELYIINENDELKRPESIINKAIPLSEEITDKQDRIWNLVWIDEFSSDQIDTTKWNKIFRKNNSNNEIQYYLKGNISQREGDLYLTAKKEEAVGYTSGMIDTKDKFSFCYGRVDICAKLPEGVGLFPAIWLLPKSIESLPEIDIMEMVGDAPQRIYGVNHYAQGDKILNTFGEVRVETYDEFHVYSLVWSKNKLEWYLDDKLFHKSNLGVPKIHMYIIFNLAVGGNWPGHPSEFTVFPSSIVFDYIKIYKRVYNDTTFYLGEFR